MKIYCEDLPPKAKVDVKVSRDSDGDSRLNHPLCQKGISCIIRGYNWGHFGKFNVESQT